jgi:hypothetical protein
MSIFKPSYSLNRGPAPLLKITSVTNLRNPQAAAKKELVSKILAPVQYPCQKYKSYNNKVICRWNFNNQILCQKKQIGQLILFLTRQSEKD